MSAAVDYEVEYNNRARVPENPALIAGWARDAAAYRERHAPRVIPYGPGERNRIDFFAGDGDGPIVVFIHGGYWQALDGSFFSHLAARAERPRHRASPFRATIFVPPSPSTTSSSRCGWRRANWRGSAGRS